MPHLLHKISRLLVIIALLVACGGHWVVLQSVAWTSMVVSFSHDGGVMEALEKTFDGQHPCSLCKSIQNGKAGEQKQDVQVVVAKLNLIYQSSVVILVRNGDSWEQGVPTFRAPMRAVAPPTPPPRAALA